MTKIPSRFLVSATLSLLLQILNLLLLLLDNVHNKRTAEENRRLINRMMLVARNGCSDTMSNLENVAPWGEEWQENSYLKVPTPPASSRNVGPSSRDFPAHRCAKARRMWPWATTRTSPLWFSSLPPVIVGACHLSRISLIRRSSRSVTSEGTLLVYANDQLSESLIWDGLIKREVRMWGVG